MIIGRPGIDVYGISSHQIADFLIVTGSRPLDLAPPAEARAKRYFTAKPNVPFVHPGPFYTDNFIHNLKRERFFAPYTSNAAKESAKWFATYLK